MIREPSTAAILIGAGVVGTVIGLGSVAMAPSGRSAIAVAAGKAFDATKAKRLRDPRPGDVWTGCNDARAAGTAPIYRDEPGYRSDMDGDDDGIACEPHRD